MIPLQRAFLIAQRNFKSTQSVSNSQAADHDTLLFRASKFNRLKLLIYGSYAQFGLTSTVMPIMLLNGSSDVSMLSKSLVAGTCMFFVSAVAAGANFIRKKYIVEAALDNDCPKDTPQNKREIIFGKPDWLCNVEYFSVNVEDIYPTLGWPHLETTKKMISDMQENGKSYDIRKEGQYLFQIKHGNSFMLEMPSSGGDLGLFEDLVKGNKTSTLDIFKKRVVAQPLADSEAVPAPSGLDVNTNSNSEFVSTHSSSSSTTSSANSVIDTTATETKESQLTSTKSTS